MDERCFTPGRLLHRLHSTSQDFPGIYHRRLLIGAGIAVTFAVLGATLSVFTLQLTSLAAEFEREFNSEQETIKVYRDKYYKSLMLSVKSYELHKEHPRYHGLDIPRYRQLLDQGGGLLTIPVEPVNRVLTVVSTDNGSVFTERLKMTLALMRTPLRFQLNKGYGLRVFIYSTDRHFLASWPPLPEAKIQLIRKEGRQSFIEQSVIAVEAAIERVPPAEMQEQRIVWLDTRRSPITGEWVSQFAVPIYDNEKRIAVAVVEIPIDRFAALFQNARPIYRFFVLSQDLKHVFDIQSLDKPEKTWVGLIPRVISKYGEDDPAYDDYEIPEWNLLDGVRPTHINMHWEYFTLYIYQRIAGPDWFAVYVIDWRTLMEEMEGRLFYLLVIDLIMLFLLWGGVISFDRMVLVPLITRAKQVYEGEAFNRVVLATAPVGLIVYELGSNLVVMQNEMARELLGAKDGTDEVYSSLIKDLSFAAGEVSKKRPMEIGVVNHTEVRLTASNGIRRELAVDFARANYQRREVVVLGLTDISDQKSAFRLLEHARETADQANQSKSMFLATMSHEIRTPLHGALGNLELLAIEHLTVRQRERVSTIRRAFDTLLLLINDILDLSKIEAGELRLNEELFRLDELVEQCGQTIIPLLLERNVRFFCLVDPYLAGVWSGDGHRINQLLMNLLSNARKFTERGAVTLRALLLDANEEGQRVRFSVSDTGIGISSLQLKRIFEPFVQADSSIASRYGGTGLGLALCKRIVDLMAGEITVDSLEGEGTIFTITLPLVRHREDAPEAQLITKPLFRSAVVVCDSLLWQFNLMAQIQYWLPDIQLVSAELDAPVAAHDDQSIIVFSTFCHDIPEAWSELQDTYLDRLVLSGDGPLTPERRNDSWYLTSLSSSRLKYALTLCGRHNSIVPRSPLNPHRAPHQREDVKFLVAEDDPVNRKLIQHQLAALGYDRVDIVENGKAALDLCRANTYDLVITDLGMPIMSGQTFLTELRRHKIDVPAIACTAEAAGEIQAKLLGFADILHKPVSLDRLRGAIEGVLKLPVSAVAVPAVISRLSPIDKQMQELFLAGWEEEKANLLAALDMTDSKRFLARLHRLKGALLALQESDLVVDCDRLKLLVEAQGIEASQEVAQTFFVKMQILTEDYRRVLSG